mmetsp:Transcript_12390/g.20957  ORF Transcript_12390/g.20957 Transcript_12390/m.20957 type:complete len:328 (+) Transcript_12390:290-1273(+)
MNSEQLCHKAVFFFGFCILIGVVSFILVEEYPFTVLYSVPATAVEPLQFEGEIPFVQVYFPRCPLHLRIHLWQVTRLNKRVILIGDESCKRFCDEYGIKLYDYSNYNTSATEFGKLFPRNSTNGERWDGKKRDFELRCYNRWFVLHEFMSKESIQRVFYADADTMLYQNLTEVVHRHFPTTDLAFIYSPPTVTVSYALLSTRGLGDILEFMRQVFRQWHDVFLLAKASDFHAHVNDMIAVKMYSLRSIGLQNVHCVHLQLHKGNFWCLRKMYYNGSMTVDYQPKIPFQSLSEVSLSPEPRLCIYVCLCIYYLHIHLNDYLTADLCNL